MANAPSTIAGSTLVTWDSGKFFYTGDVVVAGPNFPDTLFGNNKAVSYGNGVRTATHTEIEFVADGAAIEVWQKGTSSPSRMRFVVDGKLASATAVEYPGDGSGYLTRIDFGTRATRRVRILGNGPHFGGVRVAPGDTIAKPPADTGFRAMFVGDSITEGPSGQVAETSFAPVAAQLLGWSDAWVSGVGATGYLASPSGRLTFRQRFDADVKAYAPNVLVIAGGTNDVGFTDAQVQAEAALLFGRIQNEMPDTLVFVVGLWNPRSAYRASLNDAIKAAAAGRPNFYWVPVYEDHWITGTGRVGAPAGDGNSDWVVSSDGTHPSPAGIDYLGGKVNDAVRALIQ